jgi:hypothetical protein
VIEIEERGIDLQRERVKHQQQAGGGNDGRIYLTQLQTLFLSRSNLNLSLTKLAVHVLFKRLASLEAGSRGNTLVPVIVTSDTRVQWSTLLREVDRVRSLADNT